MRFYQPFTFCLHCANKQASKPQSPVERMWYWAAGREESKRGPVKRAAGGREPTCSKKD